METPSPSPRKLSPKLLKSLLLLAILVGLFIGTAWRSPVASASAGARDYSSEQATTTFVWPTFVWPAFVWPEELVIPDVKGLLGSPDKHIRDEQATSTQTRPEEILLPDRKRAPDSPCCSDSKVASSLAAIAQPESMPSIGQPEPPGTHDNAVLTQNQAAQSSAWQVLHYESSVRNIASTLPIYRGPRGPPYELRPEAHLVPDRFNSYRFNSPSQISRPGYSPVRRPGLRR